MKKALLYTIGILFFVLMVGEQLFSSTAFFSTKDGRVFCETDSFDGSYRICTKAQSTGTGLIKAERYNPRLVETTTGKICVEDGKEIDATQCQIPPKPTVIAAPIITTTGASTTTATGKVGTPITATGNTGTTIKPTVVPIPTTTATGNSNIVTGSTQQELVPIPPITTNTAATTPETSSGPVTPLAVIPGVPAVTENTLISSIVTAFKACTGDIPNLNCPKALSKMTDTFLGMSTTIIIVICIVFLSCTIFWFNMISHAFANPIPIKPIWIILLLVLSVPGAILYYFAGLRPYEAKVLASLPPRPPSFFY